MAHYKEKNIIIIGAGISGLACAISLKERGFRNVSILEAGNRIGGRIQTISLGKHYIEMGAQWIHGQQNNVIYEIAKSNDLVNENSDNYLDVISSFSLLPKEKKNIICPFLEYINDKMNNIFDCNISGSSALSYLDNQYENFLKDISHPLKECIHEAYGWFCKFQCEINGCQNLSLLSSNSTYEECSGSQNVELKYGYSSIINLFLKIIPKDWILKNHLVNKIDWSDFSDENTTHLKKCTSISNILEQSKNFKVKVFCKNGKKYCADHVVITIPLGYLKKYNQSLFYPCLSKNKQKAISSFGFDTVNKVFLEFDPPFWDANTMINVLWHEKFEKYFPVQEVEFDTRFGKTPSQHWVKSINRFAYTLSHPKMLCAWVAGEGAVTLEFLQEKQIVDDCMTLLELLLDKELPKPSKILRSTWFSDPFTCGSYSYLSVECKKQKVSHQAIAEPEYANVLDSQHPVLLFAGEASHERYYSTVHGACESGFREAERLFDYYRNLEKNVQSDYIISINDKVKKLLSTNTRLHRNLKVVVIGAGIAGLSCASHLFKNDFTDVFILEAQNRIGGRVHSVKYGDNFLEFGAQWIHGTENELYKFVKDQMILPAIQKDLSYEGKGLFCCSSGYVIEPNLVEEVKQVLDDAKSLLEKEQYCSKDSKSVFRFFSEAYDSHFLNTGDKSNCAVKKGLFDWFIKFEVIDNACDTLDDIACQSYADWDDCPPDEYHINIEKGFYSIIDALTSMIPNDKIFVNQAVKLVKWRKDFTENDFSFQPCNEKNLPVLVKCEDGKEFFADCVIVTAAIGFLKENCNAFFVPPLPTDKIKAFESIGFGTINKIYLIYDTPFWHPDDLGIQLVWINELTDECKRLLQENPWVKGITGFDIVKKMPNVLLGWIGGEEAKLIENISEEVIDSVCTKLLGLFLNRPDIPNPVTVYRSQWFQNRYIRGSYCNRKLSFYQSDSTLLDLQSPLISSVTTKNNTKVQWPTVLFSGEAFDSHSFSSAHGAYQSGLQAAELLIKAYSEIDQVKISTD